MTQHNPLDPNWTREELDGYLQDRYVTQQDLAAQTNLQSGYIDQLVKAGCVPGPSYEMRNREELYAYINSKVNTISVQPIARYFAKDVIAWIELIRPRLGDGSLENLGKIIEGELRSDFLKGLDLHGAAKIGYEGFVAPDGAIDNDGMEEHYNEYIWPNWREGTWGICVYDSENMQNVARKTIAVNRLKLLTDDGSKTAYSKSEADEVRRAMIEYDAIVPPFSPHDRHESSRARLVESLAHLVGYDLS